MERLALYLRLSLEDEGEKDESNSISNQRKLIYEYSDYGYTKRECDFEYDKDGSKEFATNYRRSRL